jgi:tetratricopeptide (TPR) repeat protein
VPSAPRDLFDEAARSARGADMKLALLPLCVVCLVASSALAEGASSDEPAAYSEAIREAVNEFQLGHLSEAREQFRKAHAIDPNGRTFRGLGIVEFELRHYRESTALLEQALKSTRKPLEGKMRAETERTLARARAYVGTVRIETDPVGATVVVDDSVVDLDPSGAVLLEVGDHELEFHASGRLSTKQTVSVQGGQMQTVHVALRRLVEAEATTQSPGIDLKASSTPAKKESPALYQKWWFWTAVGVAVAASATTTVLLLNHRDTRTVPLGTTNTPPGSTIQTLRLAL